MLNSFLAYVVSIKNKLVTTRSFGIAQTSWGYLYIFGEPLTHFFLRAIPDPNIIQNCALQKTLCQQAEAIVKGYRPDLFPEGTPFQSLFGRRHKIPKGKIVTYQDIAFAIHKPKAVGLWDRL